MGVSLDCNKERRFETAVLIRRRCRHRRSLGLRGNGVLQIAVVLVPGAEHEQEDEHDYEALFGRRENKQIEEPFHFSA
jgi:hypothetical protein